jgi:hypothetical protein
MEVVKRNRANTGKAEPLRETEKVCGFSGSREKRKKKKKKEKNHLSNFLCFLRGWS